MKINTYALLSILTLCLFVFAPEAQAKKLKLRLCMKDSGAIVAKRRCNIGETVINADALNALTAQLAPITGPEGPEGEPGSAIAYARILVSGLVDADATKDITSDNIVLHPSYTGLYCFFDLPFNPTVAVVTVERFSHDIWDQGAVVAAANAGPEEVGEKRCDALGLGKSDASVTVTNISTGLGQNHQFFIWFEE